MEQVSPREMPADANPKNTPSVSIVVGLCAIAIGPFAVGILGIGGIPKDGRGGGGMLQGG